jgi:hypothetical protein
MNDFTSPWLETPKMPSQRTDCTDSHIEPRLAVSAVSATTRGKAAYKESESLDDIRAVIADMPPSDQWNVDETAARILALSEAERAAYYAALIHDWRAWRLAMDRFGEEEKVR